MAFRRGARLGVDVGSVRIGVARCDPDGILATPVATVKRGEGDIAEILRLADECGAMEIVVGLPVTLAGAAGQAARIVEEFACQIAQASPVPVRLVDERLSTVAAQRQLVSAGRDTRKSRSVIDQAAATLIVQSAVDAEKATGTPAGRMVPPDEQCRSVDGPVAEAPAADGKRRG